MVRAENGEMAPIDDNLAERCGTDAASMSGGDQYLSPEARARVDIDLMLEAAGWVFQNRNAIDLFAGRGVAVREFMLIGNKEADYLLFVDRQAVGALEAKKQGFVEELTAAAAELGAAASPIDGDA